MPHILLSSSNGSRNGVLLESNISQRTCASGECRTRRNGVEAHTVQVVDKPGQILASQVRSSISVFTPAEDVDKLVVKTRRSSVEIAKFLQGARRGHGGRCSRAQRSAFTVHVS